VTVCIAALCEDGKKVVACSDRMVTATYPPIEFEHGTPKMDQIAPTCIVLSSGDALAHSEVCRLATEQLGGLVRPTVKLMAESVKESYAKQRQKRIEERFLAPRGWTLSGFYGGTVNIPADLKMVIDSQIHSFDYGLNLIILGTDPGQAHIYGLRHPGEVDCYDALGYHSIGIGAMHAMSSLIGNNFVPSLDTKWATYYVYEAKRNAETAPGVGMATDLSIIDASERKNLTEDDIDALRNIYEKRHAPLGEEIEQLVTELSF